MKIERSRLWTAGLLAAGALFAAAGCERKEKVLDIETPRTDVEVQRSRDTGEVDVHVDRDP